MRTRNKPSSSSPRQTKEWLAAPRHHAILNEILDRADPWSARRLEHCSGFFSGLTVWEPKYEGGAFGLSSKKRRNWLYDLKLHPSTKGWTCALSRRVRVFLSAGTRDPHSPSFRNRTPRTASLVQVLAAFLRSTKPLGPRPALACDCCRRALVA